MNDKSWNEAMALAKEANLLMLRGNPEPLKSLYSHRDDVTVLGGFGGFERGWQEVGPRLDWAASHFSNGHFEQEDISTIVGSDLAMTVTIERYTVRIDGAANETAEELRVTQIFRREADGWKLVHRHGDPLVNKRSPSGS
jgi:ketosteroid isomerase-like protein